jgi:hypothetical protein
MTGRELISTAIAAALSFAVGTYVGVQWSTGYGKKADNAALRSEQFELQRLREENRNLRDQLERPEATVPSGGAQSMMPQTDQGAQGEWRALANMKAQNIAQPRVTVVSRNGQLNDTFVALFDLEPSDRESLQLAINRSTEKLAALEAQNATVSRDEKGIVTIAVKAFPGPGGVVYDELMKSFYDTLGQERYGAFLALGALQVEVALAMFGAQDRILRVSFDPQRERIPYVVKDEYRIGPRIGHADTSTFQHREEIPARIGTLARLLPPDLGPKK